MAIKAELMGFVHEINRADRVARSVSSYADAKQLSSDAARDYDAHSSNSMWRQLQTKNSHPLRVGTGSGSSSAPGRRCCSFATAGGVDDRIGARGCPGCLIKV